MTKRTLLFVDDEPHLLDIHKKFFEPKGFRVLTAENGQKGLALARKEKPSVMILDIRMPQMDGVEVLKRLRKKDKETKVIMLTGYGTADYLRVSSELGITDFISKPFSLDALQRVIAEVLGRAME